MKKSVNFRGSRKGQAKHTTGKGILKLLDRLKIPDSEKKRILTSIKENFEHNLTGRESK